MDRSKAYSWLFHMCAHNFAGTGNLESLNVHSLEKSVSRETATLPHEATADWQIGTFEDTFAPITANFKQIMPLRRPDEIPRESQLPDIQLRGGHQRRSLPPQHMPELVDIGQRRCG